MLPSAQTWCWPLPPPHHVVRGFDPPIQPWLAGHRGVDLAGTPGEPVLAAGEGVIAFAGRIAGVPIVSVQHPNGLRTTYQPVVTRRKPGIAVMPGEQIGRLVLTGSHCLPAACLHWGLKRAADYLDPLAMLKLNPVRLLPFDQPTPSAAPVSLIGSAAGGVALVSGGLLVAFNARVSSLVPLFAIGLFASFTLSQTGMVMRHLRRREPGWARGL